MTARHEPNDERRRTVQTMAGFGIPQAEIAKVIAVSLKTLRLYYRAELDLGVIVVSSAVAQSLYRLALGDGHEAVTACIFWLKVRAGWSERVPSIPVQHLGKKQQAERDAATAGAGTPWAALVN